MPWGELVGGIARPRNCSYFPLETADAASISFLSNPRYATQMAASKAACVIVAPAMRDAAVCVVLHCGCEPLRVLRAFDAILACEKNKGLNLRYSLDGGG